MSIIEDIKELNKKELYRPCLETRSYKLIERDLEIGDLFTVDKRQIFYYCDDYLLDIMTGVKFEIESWIL